MNKIRLYLLGLLTLLMVPLAWLLQWMPPLKDFFRPDELLNTWTLIGAEFGIVFGIVMLIATSTETARVNFNYQIQLIRSLRLTIWDCLFLSFCAGIGEEFLFRIALQEWVHPIPSAIIFVAIHGYIRPKNWDITKYGLLVLIFILALSYAISVQGLGFCIAAHAAYDFVLFYSWSNYKSVD